MASSSYNDNNRSHKNDKILQNIIERSRRDFDDSNLLQFYQDRFEQEIRQYEECNKKGDYADAFYHYDFAHSINEYLKALESVRTK
jgi:hypothetical protein